MSFLFYWSQSRNTMVTMQKHNGYNVEPPVMCLCCLGEKLWHHIENTLYWKYKTPMFAKCEVVLTKKKRQISSRKTIITSLTALLEILDIQCMSHYIITKLLISFAIQLILILYKVSFLHGKLSQRVLEAKPQRIYNGTLLPKYRLNF